MVEQRLGWTVEERLEWEDISVTLAPTKRFVVMLERAAFVSCEDYCYAPSSLAGSLHAMEFIERIKRSCLPEILFLHLRTRCFV